MYPSLTNLQDKSVALLSDKQELNFGLKLESTTIMFADIVESVRLIEQSELKNVIRIRTLLKHLAERVVPDFSGKVLERRGDGLLIRFSHGSDAARCALKMHFESERASYGYGQNEVIALRIGAHRSNVISDESAIYGQGINLASRVASLAGPGETVFSGEARDELVAGLDGDVEDLGDCYLKHVPEPIRAFRVGTIGPAPVLPKQLADLNDSLPCIAVLPFEVSGDEEASTAADLLSETLTHCLARAGSLKVLAWISSKVVGNHAMPAKQSGAMLGADWVIAGSCHVHAGRILVSAQLIRAKTELVTHSERLSNNVSDLLEQESELAGQLASRFVHAVTESEAKRVSKHALPSLSSHTLLLGAVGLMHRSGPIDFMRGRDALEHLLERQPRMHSARPWLAKWYVLRTTRGMSAPEPQEARRALEQTSRALDSREDDAFALAIQGFIFFHMLKDVARAKEKLNLAVQINPSEPLANVFNSALVNATGEYETAWQLAQRALTLSPFDPLRAYIRMIAAASALTTERFSVATELARSSLKENASHPATWRTLVIALSLGGELAQAREAAKQLMRLEPSLTLVTYASRISWPEPIKSRVVEALRIAGVPAN
jgi:adenylate cyclase